MMKLRSLVLAFATALIAALPAAAESQVPDRLQKILDRGVLRVGTTISEAEKALILRTLQHTKNNKTRAAEILGISLKTLHNKLKEYGSAESESSSAGQ